MKTALFTIALLAFMCQVNLAQDVIIYKDGTEAKGKVTEITDNEVKFKKVDNLDGPVYTVTKAEIFMIQYENGSKDFFGDTPVPETETSNSKPKKYFNPEQLKFSGPRIGFTVIGQGSTSDYIKDELGKKPFVTQFGWQLETRVFTLDNGTSGLFEWVALIGGVEQGMFLPSVSGLFGVRNKKGYEIGMGPNLSVSGLAMVFAVGTSFRSENVYFPVNLAVVTSVARKVEKMDPDGNYYDFIEHTGVRIGLTVGFNTRKS